MKTWAEVEWAPHPPRNFLGIVMSFQWNKGETRRLDVVKLALTHSMGSGTSLLDTAETFLPSSELWTGGSRRVRFFEAHSSNIQKFGSFFVLDWEEKTLLCVWAQCWLEFWLSGSLWSYRRTWRTKTSERKIWITFISPKIYFIQLYKTENSSFWCMHHWVIRPGTIAAFTSAQQVVQFQCKVNDTIRGPAVWFQRRA